MSNNGSEFLSQLDRALTLIRKQPTERNAAEASLDTDEPPYQYGHMKNVDVKEATYWR